MTIERTFGLFGWAQMQNANSETQGREREQYHLIVATDTTQCRSLTACGQQIDNKTILGIDSFPNNAHLCEECLCLLEGVVPGNCVRTNASKRVFENVPFAVLQGEEFLWAGSPPKNQPLLEHLRHKPV